MLYMSVIIVLYISVRNLFAEGLSWYLWLCGFSCTFMSLLVVDKCVPYKKKVIHSILNPQFMCTYCFNVKIIVKSTTQFNKVYCTTPVQLSLVVMVKIIIHVQPLQSYGRTSQVGIT